MKIAVVYNKNIKKSAEAINKIKSELINSSFEYSFLDIDKLSDGYDFVCAIGGDGTMLKASGFYAKSKTPVMGINLGRLGFLSLLAPENIKSIIDIIEKKDYVIQKRIMLQSSDCTALNDFVIKGHSPVRTSKFNLYIDKKLVSEYIADGLIISTPTGSTAYGLSAGGPILYPDLDAIVIVPICAHTMTSRPLVIPDSSKITVKSVDELLDVSCDGHETIVKVNEVNIELSKYKAYLAFPKNENFYSILRNKLHWGISPVSSVQEFLQ